MDITKHLLRSWPIIPLSFRDGRQAWNDFRAAEDRQPQPLLTPPKGNAKLWKTMKTGVIVYSLSLAQSTTSGIGNDCPFSTSCCRDGCVAKAGRGAANRTTEGRAKRTRFLVEQPDAFLGVLMHEIEHVWRTHGKRGRIRLNTFSDLPWELIYPELFSTFPKMKFYDYTKWPMFSWQPRSTAGIRHPHQLPPNYRLTFSASELTKDAEIIGLVRGDQKNVAVVFDTPRTAKLPPVYIGSRVIDGDATDDRYSDPNGVIVGLRAKGPMRRTLDNGMVRRVT